VRRLVPSLTFPNHYTIVTVSFQAPRIVNNNMLTLWTAPGPDQRHTRVPASRCGGEPLWVTAEKAGRADRHAVLPGSEAAIGGVRPTFWKRTKRGFRLIARGHRAAWLCAPTAWARFVTLYMSDVDHAGHGAGPDADETRTAVAR